MRDGSAVIGAGPREVESGEADAAVATNKDVRWRDVAVDDLMRLKMLERTQEVFGNPYLLVERERERWLFNMEAQCLSGSVLGDKEVPILGFAREEVTYGDDAGVPGIELRARYAFEIRRRCFSRSACGLYGSA